MSDIYYVNNDITINGEVVIPQDSLISNVVFAFGSINMRFIMNAEFNHKGKEYQFGRNLLLDNSFLITMEDVMDIYTKKYPCDVPIEDIEEMLREAI